jgi:hypothetical protein
MRLRWKQRKTQSENEIFAHSEAVVAHYCAIERVSEYFSASMEINLTLISSVSQWKWMLAHSFSNNALPARTLIELFHFILQFVHSFFVFISMFDLVA